MTDISSMSLNGLSIGDAPLGVNRVVIEKGENKQLVYYWFQQRGKTIASEYAVKWHMLVDSIKDNITDVSLVRLTTLVVLHEDIENADRKLLDFAQQVTPLLHDYIPE